MRSISLILISFLYLCLGLAAASALPNDYAVRRRDDPAPSSSNNAPPASSSNGNDHNSFPPLSTSTKPAPTNTQAPVSSGAPSQSGSGSNGPASNSTITSAAVSSMPSATSSASPVAAADGQALPIQPRLTAAMAIGGVILVVSGLIYAFVGIKSRKVQVFISTAYLISLGTTVLIVYVMTPPVSASTQGAYLAAVVIPGLIVGGGAVIFKDVAEGLGCAVGGFALGMWLLTLTPGGLISSSAGKIVLLCTLTAVAFSLSFSRYTRTYGIIGATAFAGSTTLVLGIDCFAQTGLKEFWLYIWALNNNLFPLGTSTYPLTKSIKAEIAGIVICTLFGILSQIQVWKIVQKKRAKRAEAETKRQHEQDIEEARLGKEVEARNQAEKMIWERAYSEAPRDLHSDSGIGSEPSNSEKGSVRNYAHGKLEDNVEVTETDDLAATRAAKAAKRLTPHIIVSVAEEDEEDSMPGSATIASPMRHLEEQPSDSDSKVKLPQATITELDPTLVESLKGKSLKPKSAPSPIVVPLPFNIPNGQESPRDRDDASSVATAATSIENMGKRLSSGSLLEKMAKGRLSFHSRKESDAFSLQANLDSPIRDEFDTSSRQASRRPSKDTLRSRPVSLVASKSSPPTSPGLERLAPSSPTTILNETVAPLVTGEANAETEEIKPSSPLNLDSIKANTSGTSKVMHAFRTNEWAKHLEGAQEPEEDELPVSGPPSPMLPISAEAAMDAAKPALPELLVPKAIESSDPPSPASVTASSSVDEQLQKATWPKPSSRRRSSAAPSQAPVDSRSPPAMTRQSSREGRSSQTMSMLRSSSGSRTRTTKARQVGPHDMVTSPIQEDVEAFFPPTNKGPSSFEAPQHSLLAHRDAMASQSSLTRSVSQSSQGPYTYQTQSSSQVSLPQRPASTLSRRSSNPENYAYLQGRSSMNSMRSSGQPYSPPVPVRTYSQMSHVPLTHAMPPPNPDRSLHYKATAVDNDMRTGMLAQWRSSIVDDQVQRQANQFNVDLDMTRAGTGWIEAQRQQREGERYRQQAVGWGKERVVSPTAIGNNAQRQMAAHDAHREVLRRMQSKSKV